MTADPRPDDAPPLTGESEALSAMVSGWWDPGDWKGHREFDDHLRRIERAARADAEAVVSDYPRVMAERDGWRREAARLRGALGRIERKALDWQARSVAEENAAASGLSDIALTSRAALAPRGGGE